MSQIVSKTIILGLSFLLTAISCQSNAGMRSYGSNIENSKWNLTTDSRLSCDLTHEIPRYGFAFFKSHAGKKDNLQFELDMLRLPTNYSVASVEAVPPPWRPGKASRIIDQLNWYQQFDGELNESASWQMLAELEKGNFPTIYYTDWHNETDRVKVFLASTNFRDAYDEFLNCRSRLLPYAFEDISTLDLRFEFGGSDLDKPSKAKLAQVKEYLRHDADIEQISVKAYSDSWGGRWHNYLVSKKRAEQIKQFFVQAGIDASKVSVEGFGEKRHIASNETELGREENRRVIVEMVKP
jgi:outer membrane protein OmpA-like peptidoglycan-associated protein